MAVIKVTKKGKNIELKDICIGMEEDGMILLSIKKLTVMAISNLTGTIMISISKAKRRGLKVKIIE